ncbi:MAG TPA: hypothetical protein VFG19_13835 [Geobacteraceae bacterium]|nr:hypothetical protein [Geobacteraceae bacterium]
MEINELEELALNIRKLVDGNRKFLDKVMDEDFEPEETEEEIEESTIEDFEEL